MKSIDLIIENAGSIITCASNSKPKKGGEMAEIGLFAGDAIAIDQGNILEIGSSGLFRRTYDAKKSYDAKGMTVSPGLIDPHTHIVFGGNRYAEFELRIKGASYLEIMEAGGGIVNTVAQTRLESREKLVESALSRLDAMLESGVTTVEIKTGYGLDLPTEIKMLEVISDLFEIHPVKIIPTFLAAHAIPDEWNGLEDEFTKKICVEFLPAAWNWYKNSSFPSRGIPFFVDVFCERNAFNLKQTKEVIGAALDLGFEVKAHVDEFTNLGGAAYSIEKGATSIDHLDATSMEEVLLLAGSNTVGVVTPTVNFNLGSKEFADARSMIDAGCAIAISTDYNPGSAPCSSLPLAMAIGCRYQKMLPAEVFSAATINAAFAVKYEDRVGSIEGGKAADIVIWDTVDYRQIPYEFGRNLVHSVLIDGKFVLKGDGKTRARRK